MTTTPLLQSTLAACREEPDEPAHRAALHDLLVEELGITDERLLSACLTGHWEGTLAEWWGQGPSVVAMVCVREDGVRLVDRVPACMDGAYYWALWEERDVIAQFDLPKEWWPSPSVTRLVVRWINYDSPEAAHLDASRRAVRWAMKEAEKRAKEGAA